MDIELEGEMNGIETARQIKSQLDIPVIYLTSFSDDTMLAKALETEPSGYLLKPFFARELHTSIQTAINKSAIEKAEAVIDKAERGKIKLSEDQIQRIKETLSKILVIFHS